MQKYLLFLSATLMAVLFIFQNCGKRNLNGFEILGSAEVQTLSNFYDPEVIPCSQYKLQSSSELQHCNCSKADFNKKAPKVYGSGLYSIASDICSAAIHSGSYEGNNNKTVSFWSGTSCKKFLSTVQNGITSKASSPTMLRPTFYFDLEENICPGAVEQSFDNRKRSVTCPGGVLSWTSTDGSQCSASVQEYTGAGSKSRLAEDSSTDGSATGTAAFTCVSSAGASQSGSWKSNGSSQCSQGGQVPQCGSFGHGQGVTSAADLNEIYLCSKGMPTPVSWQVSPAAFIWSCRGTGANKNSTANCSLASDSYANPFEKSGSGSTDPESESPIFITSWLYPGSVEPNEPNLFLEFTATGAYSQGAWLHSYAIDKSPKVSNSTTWNSLNSNDVTYGQDEASQYYNATAKIPFTFKNESAAGSYFLHLQDRSGNIKSSSGISIKVACDPGSSFVSGSRCALTQSKITSDQEWSVPRSTSCIKVKLVGAGGGGAQGRCDENSCYGGGGGGGGEVVTYEINVKGGKLAFTIGKGGAGSLKDNGDGRRDSGDLKAGKSGGKTEMKNLTNPSSSSFSCFAAGGKGGGDGNLASNRGGPGGTNKTDCELKQGTTAWTYKTKTVVAGKVGANNSKNAGGKGGGAGGAESGGGEGSNNKDCTSTATSAGVGTLGSGGGGGWLSGKCKDKGTDGAKGGDGYVEISPCS